MYKRQPTEYLPVPGTGYLTSPVQTYDPRVMDRTARIIVGVDHSQESLNALEFAVEEAALRRVELEVIWAWSCLLYTSPSPPDRTRYRMPSSA